MGVSVILDRVAIEFLCHSSQERFICDLSEDIGRELIFRISFSLLADLRRF
jgi:hypothetical protein